ncbi:hypothetical protein HCN44_002145 [Aphidius gifuensis]|uniref:Peptidase S1 domain-containing protein n=1 Tax=Aphidius gifuensis TaxID=684658 RepID=A0A835CWM3_APHGI|nr:hypothetical protein HCN44_002145 [Aphidius gifuensis]
MARILINSIVLYLVAFIYDVNGKLSNKLVGGAYGYITDYPFQVSVRIHGDHHLCGGCIISNFHVLTSASCITSDVNIILGNLKVLSGTNDRNNRDNYGKIHDVDLVIIHHEYSPRKFWANDICLLKLSNELQFNRQVVLPSIEFLYERFHLEIIGWGKPPLPFYIERLEKLNVYSILRTECSKYFRSGYILSPGQSCILPSIPAASFIKGDGGNPVLSFASGSFIGIVSLITTSANDPTVITELFGYYDKWMKLTTEKF